MPRQTKIFRVFVSSTFNDMKTERKLLQEKVFPELEKFCRQNSARFQAIDLRWGVSEESQCNQKTMEICLNEIRRCQQITPKPNFLILLGDRYGWQPVPAKIPQTEMNILVPLLPKEAETLVYDWYKLDTNAVPGEYVLQPRRDSFTNYALWEPIETELRLGLKEAALKAGLGQDALIKYTSSATHQEIIHGALNPPSEASAPEEHVFVLSRTINHLPEDTAAEDFIDLNEKGLRDEYSKTHLEQLKNDLAKKLGHNFIEYSVDWNGGNRSFGAQDGFDENIFVEDIISRLKTVIEEQLNVLVDEDELQTEIRYHQEFAASQTKHFIGRQSTLDVIHDYMKESQNNKVLALIGASGSGKTCVMARALELVKSDNAILVARFIGADAKTSNLLDLLSSLCTQIASAYSLRLCDLVGNSHKEKLFDYNTLAIIFTKCLTLATPKKPIIVFLDALDQLSVSNDANSWSWFPKILPDNVRLIVSALPEFENYLYDSQVIILPHMPDAEGEALLKSWLVSIRRQLTTEQKNEILDKFHQSGGSPLFLKIAFERVQRWHSFDQVDPLANSISDVICQFMQTLEKEHSPQLVAKAVGYLLSGKDKGLTEDEILGLLVFDEEHWHYFLQHICHDMHRSEVEEANKLPVVVWSRLYLELAPYLTERDSYGERILSFYHRQFNQVFVRKFSHTIKAFHKSLSEYFDKQPDFFDGMEQKKPNIRKCYELPYQQIQAEMWGEATDTLCDLGFLQAKAAAKMTLQIMDEISAVLRTIPENVSIYRTERELQDRLSRYGRDLVNFARKSIHKLEAPESAPPLSQEYIEAETDRIIKMPKRTDQLRDFLGFLGKEADGIQCYADSIPNFVFQQAWNYSDSGPVANASAKMSKEIKDRLLLKLPSLRPRWSAMPPIRRHMKMDTNDVQFFGMAANRQVFVTSSKDCIISLWDTETGILKRSFTINNLVVSLCTTPDNHYILTSHSDGKIILWDIESGKPIRLIQYESVVKCMSLTPDIKYAITQGFEGHGHTLLLWDLETGEILKSLNQPKEFVRAVSIAPDGNQALTCSDDNSILLWNLTSGQAIHRLNGHSWYISDISATPDYKFAISASWDHSLIVWDLRSGVPLVSLKAHSGDVYSASITPDGRYAVSGGEDTNVILWDVVLGKPIGTMIGHTSQINAVSISADARFILSVSKDNTMIQWNPILGNVKQNIDKHSSRVNAIVIEPHKQRAVTAAGGFISHDYKLLVWDILKGSVINSLSFHQAPVTKLKLLPGGRRLLSGSVDRSLVLWDLNTGEPIRTLVGHESYIEHILVTPDGKRAVVISSRQMIIWDLESGTPLNIIRTVGSDIGTITITPDGRYTVYGESDKLVVINLDSGLLSYEIKFKRSTFDILSITIDGRYVISGSRANAIKVWDLETGLLKYSKKDYKKAKCLGLSSDGRHAICLYDSKGFISWDIKSGKTLGILKQKIEGIVNFGITSDDHHILFKSDADTIMIAAFGANNVMFTLREPNSTIRLLSQDGKRAFLVNNYKDLIIIDIITGKRKAVFPWMSKITALAEYNGGIMFGDEIGNIHILTIDQNIPQHSRCLITARFIWMFKEKKYVGPFADCPNCETRFVLPNKVLEAINKYLHNSNKNLKTTIFKSIFCKTICRADYRQPSFLPKEAWEEDPHLLSSCPECKEALRFNPFLVDPEGRYQ